MANRRFNTQTRKAAMGGGMMKRGMYKKGSFPDMSGAVSYTHLTLPTILLV